MKDIKEVLQENTIIKNHKALCELLGWDFKQSTNSKNRQLNELSLYCDYHKEGHKIIIDKIHNEPKKKVANKNLLTLTNRSCCSWLGLYSRM